LAVCAHPDDESFGLGAVLSTFDELGIETRLLCFTHGEASTLGASRAELAVVRAAELSAAASVLGVRSVRLLSYPDGALSDTHLDELSREVESSATLNTVDCLLVLDEGGITGHPDHRRATDAAVMAGERLRVPVLAWALPLPLTSALNSEFGAAFAGREAAEIDLVLEVDRGRQHQAIACHASQSTENPVLWRRLSLQGDTESLRWLGTSSRRAS
jgi:LmbE family N-acetylglucosaminyl deacetylase